MTPASNPVGVGFVTPEDYLAMSDEERRDPETWARIEASRKHWPKTFDPHELPVLEEDGSVSWPLARRRRNYNP